MAVREIIVIDEEKCDGCGKCVSACEEGAIAIVDGKARLVKESYCDGLGHCIGECPRGAITIERREAEEFVERQEDTSGVKGQAEGQACGCSDNHMHNHMHETGFSCPGSAVRMLNVAERSKNNSSSEGNMIGGNKVGSGVDDIGVSRLANWPVQLKLVPVNAPYLQNSKLLIAADCVCCAYPRFHSDLVEGKIVIIACPKLDDANFYVDKLTEMFKMNRILHITIAYMEVPCCTGLIRIIERAIEAAGVDITLTKVRIGINGNILSVN